LSSQAPPVEAGNQPQIPVHRPITLPDASDANNLTTSLQAERTGTEAEENTVGSVTHASKLLMEKVRLIFTSVHSICMILLLTKRAERCGRLSRCTMTLSSMTRRNNT
jgi:hypothetical protein